MNDDSGFAVWRTVAAPGSMSCIRRYVGISEKLLLLVTRAEDSELDPPTRIDEAPAARLEWLCAP
jgi:hypothetical protein